MDWKIGLKDWTSDSIYLPQKSQRVVLACIFCTAWGLFCSSFVCKCVCAHCQSRILYRKCFVFCNMFSEMYYSRGIFHVILSKHQYVCTICSEDQFNIAERNGTNTQCDVRHSSADEAQQSKPGDLQNVIKVNNLLYSGTCWNVNMSMWEKKKV